MTPVGERLPPRYRFNDKKYEHLIEPDLNRSIEAVTRLIESRGMSTSAFKGLVLVGGPAKTPLSPNQNSRVL